MSDTSQGPGWWLASDGKWYPPELWTGPPSTRPSGDPGQAQPEQPTSPATPGGSDPGYTAQPTSPAQPGYPAQGPAASPGYGGTVPPSSPPYGTAPPYGAGAAYGTGAPYGAASPYGTPPPYGTGAPYGVAAPYGPYSQGQQRKTNGLAIAALVCGCAGFLYVIPAVLGIIFGFVARSQIKNSKGAQKGEGMALAGIIVGFVWIALLVVVIIVVAATRNNNTDVVDHTLLTLHALFGVHVN